MDSTRCPDKLLELYESIWSPSGVQTLYQESIRSLLGVSGLLMDSIRICGGVSVTATGVYKMQILISSRTYKHRKGKGKRCYGTLGYPFDPSIRWNIVVSRFHPIDGF